MPTTPNPARASLIAVMTEAGCKLDLINAKLAEAGYEALTDAEAIAAGLKLPDGLTAADLLNAAPAPTEKPAKAKVAGGINAGATLGENPVTGQPVTELNMAVIGLCAQVSKILKIAHPDAWAEYQKLKEPGTVEAKIAAYEFAWKHLLKIGYQPTK